MWIFSTLGFISVVALSDEEGSDLLVRGRDANSVNAVVDGVALFLDDDADDLIVNDPAYENLATDYPHRVRVPREAFCQWLAHDIREYLSYTNFKNAVSESLGEPFTSVTHKVWADALALTAPEDVDFGYGYARMFA